MKRLLSIAAVIAYLACFSCKKHSSNYILPGSTHLLGTRNYMEAFSYLDAINDSTVFDTSFVTETITQVNDSAIKFGNSQPLFYIGADSTAGCLIYLSKAGPGALSYYYNNDSIYCDESQNGMHEIRDEYYSIH